MNLFCKTSNISQWKLSTCSIIGTLAISFLCRLFHHFNNKPFQQIPSSICRIIFFKQNLRSYVSVVMILATYSIHRIHNIADWFIHLCQMSLSLGSQGNVVLLSRAAVSRSITKSDQLTTSAAPMPTVLTQQMAQLFRPVSIGGKPTALGGKPIIISGKPAGMLAAGGRQFQIGGKPMQLITRGPTGQIGQLVQTVQQVVTSGNSSGTLNIVVTQVTID